MDYFHLKIHFERMWSVSALHNFVKAEILVYSLFEKQWNLNEKELFLWPVKVLKLQSMKVITLVTKILSNTDYFCFSDHIIRVYGENSIFYSNITKTLLSI